MRLLRVYMTSQVRHGSEAALLWCCRAFVMPREDWRASET